MKLICPDCGAQYESGKFCLECGTKLQEVAPELVCPSCGYKAKTGKFCPECGTKLTEQIVVPKELSKKVTAEHKFNERDSRFSKYYDKKGFPRPITPEERDIAIEELTSFVSQDIAEAKMLLGYILMGSSDKESVLQGVTLLKEAEEAGDKLAYYMMGYCYYLGEPLYEQNHDEAEKRLLDLYKEYKNGDTAQMLAELYAYSEKKCDYKKAFDYATIAAEEDECGGYLILGSLYLNGWGVEKDFNQALDNYKMAAALGDETAMNQMGLIYMGNEGGEENPEQSFFWFNEAAKKGSGVGMFNLGCCYRDGFGVKADLEKAAEWFKKAAELGSVEAMCELGESYLVIDPNKAKMWYLKAAELGYAEAQNIVGNMYSDRDSGFLDLKKAFNYYKKAAEQGHVYGMFNLGLCYAEGDGCTANPSKALSWIEKAANEGCSEAIQWVSNHNATLKEAPPKKGTSKKTPKKKTEQTENNEVKIENVTFKTDGHKILFITMTIMVEGPVLKDYTKPYNPATRIGNGAIVYVMQGNQTLAYSKFKKSEFHGQIMHMVTIDVSDLNLTNKNKTKMSFLLEVRAEADKKLFCSCKANINLYYEHHFIGKNVFEIR